MNPILDSLSRLSDPSRALSSARFFRTGVGEYGEGDIFLGITVPETRRVVRQYVKVMDLEGVTELLMSPYHEARLAGAIVLVDFSQKQRYSAQRLGEYYLDHLDRLNNWDLIDVSAEYVLGRYWIECLDDESRKVFSTQLLDSGDLWRIRAAVMTTFALIKQGESEPTISIAREVLRRIETTAKGSPINHDLIHKATGWMLREVGKRISESRLRAFLDQYAQVMPRTMLRYAIERLDQESRERYMKK